MIPMTLARIATVTGGTIHAADLSASHAAELVVDGPVVTDSRHAGPGGMYIARIGAQMDGHRFVAPAREAGAVAALTTRPVPELPCVIVDDIQEAFAALASAVVSAVPGLQVVGITGSSGKTTTKDLLAAVLSAAGETVANVGSLNSEVGVPLTVCRVTPETRYLVLEMGARGVGHIRYLTDMVHPRVGVVLNVGSAHAGQFGGREATAQTKGELVEALPPDGVAVLNADDPLVAAMAPRARCGIVWTGRAELGARRTGGSHPALTVAARGITSEHGRSSFTLLTPEGRARIRLKLLGDHQVDNALSAAGAATALGLDADLIAGTLSETRLQSRYRMEATERPDGVTVVNDAYNANPDSMAAALRTLAAMTPRGTGRRWLVVGEMLELGEDSVAEHRRVGELAAQLGIDRVVVVGDVAQPVRAGWGRAEGYAEVTGREAAETLLRDELGSGDVVLIKASNSIGLWGLGERLAAVGEGGENA